MHLMVSFIFLCTLALTTSIPIAAQFEGTHQVSGEASHPEPEPPAKLPSIQPYISSALSKTRKRYDDSNYSPVSNENSWSVKMNGHVRDHFLPLTYSNDGGNINSYYDARNDQRENLEDLRTGKSLETVETHPLPMYDFLKYRDRLQVHHLKEKKVQSSQNVEAVKKESTGKKDDVEHYSVETIQNIVKHYYEDVILEKVEVEVNKTVERVFNRYLELHSGETYIDPKIVHFQDKSSHSENDTNVPLRNRNLKKDEKMIDIDEKLRKMSLERIEKVFKVMRDNRTEGFITIVPIIFLLLTDERDQITAENMKNLLHEPALNSDLLLKDYGDDKREHGTSKLVVKLEKPVVLPIIQGKNTTSKNGDIKEINDSILENWESFKLVKSYLDIKDPFLDEVKTLKSEIDEPIKGNINGKVFQDRSGEYDVDALDDPVLKKFQHEEKGKLNESVANIAKEIPKFYKNENTSKINEKNINRTVSTSNKNRNHYFEELNDRIESSSSDGGGNVTDISKENTDEDQRSGASNVEGIGDPKKSLINDSAVEVNTTNIVTPSLPIHQQKGGLEPITNQTGSIADDQIITSPPKNRAPLLRRMIDDILSNLNEPQSKNVRVEFIISRPSGSDRTPALTSRAKYIDNYSNSKSVKSNVSPLAPEAAPKSQVSEDKLHSHLRTEEQAYGIESNGQQSVEQNTGAVKSTEELFQILFPSIFGEKSLPSKLNVNGVNKSVSETEDSTQGAESSRIENTDDKNENKTSGGRVKEILPIGIVIKDETFHPQFEKYYETQGGIYRFTDPEEHPEQIVEDDSE